jgi:hypothetical protein
MSKEKRKKIFYYLDEIFILLVTVSSVIFSEAVLNRAKGNNPVTGDVRLDLINLVVSSLLALMTYGLSYSDFRYTEEIKKPPLIKRLSASILNGIAWRSIIGGVN